MATKIQEKQAVIDAKNKELFDIFQAHPEHDFDQKALDDIRARNDELTALGKELDGLKELASIEEKNRKALEDDNKSAGGPSWNLGGRKNPAQPGEQKSIGQLLVESKAFTEMNKAGSHGPATEVDYDWESKAIERKTLDETAFLPQAIRLPLIVPGVLARPVVADLMPQGTTDQFAIPYMEETTTTNGAAAKTENDADPESVIEFTPKTAAVIEISTYLALSKRLLEDVPALRSYVDGRGSAFVALAEEDELLSGNGSDPHMRGLLNVVGVQTQAKGSDPTPDAIYKAMTLIQTGSEYAPNGIVMHPNDWQAIRLMRTTDGVYIWGNPSEAGPERIWSLPVIKTTKMTENTGLVGAFNLAAQIFRRRGLTLEISDSHSDFFIRSKLALRITERLAMPVYRPAAFCKVTGI